MPDRRNPVSRGVWTTAEFVLVTLIWGSTWLVIKGQLGVVPAAWSIAYRFALASLILTLAVVASGRWVRPTRAAHGFALTLAVAQFALNFNLVYAAEARVTSGLVALVFALLVVPNAVLAAVFLKVPVTRRFVVGGAIGVTGLGVVFAPDPAAVDGSRLAGLLLVATAVCCASVANVMQATRRARALPALPTLALAMAYGAAIDAIVALVTQGTPVFDPRPSYWLGLVYLAVVASVVAFSVYYDLIRRIGAGPAAYTSVIVPVVAMALSTVFEGYVWTLAAAAGAALVMVGVVVALTGRPRPPDTPAAPP